MAIKKFIVIVPNVSIDLQNIITNSFRINEFGFWHWSSDTWLIVSTIEGLNAASLRNKIMDLHPSLIIVVLEVNGGMWALNGPTRWTEWFQQSWEEK
jgi:hypothetical protein